MKWEKWTVFIAAIALAAQLGASAITGGFSVGLKIENLAAEVKLLRHEISTKNAWQDAELSNLKAKLAITQPDHKLLVGK